MTTNPCILGIIGPKGAGKSTLANLLIENHGFVRRSFAGPLKTMLAAFLTCQGASLGEARAMLDGDQKEIPTEYFGGQTPRHAMQTLGTEWGRNLIHSDIWTKVWQKSLFGATKFVVDDVRFVNEAEIIRANGGKIVRVFRDSSTNDSHSSEQEYMKIIPDLAIYNPPDNPSNMLKMLILELQRLFDLNLRSSK